MNDAAGLAASERSSTIELATDERVRYSRHLLLPEVGLEGQKRLKAAKVLVVGLGGLGSPLAMYLAAAGVGRLGLVDFDRVDASNLQRQLLYGTADIGRPKIEAAQRRLADINPAIRLDAHPHRLTADNALDIVADYDVVVDGTDNFATRYLVNDVCVLAGKPNVHGSIFRFEGQVSVFDPPNGPCYRCIYPEPPPPGLTPSCAEAGVLGILPGVIGVLQATEVVKILLGIGDSLSGRLVLFDALAMRFREVRVPRDPGCPICGERPTILEPIDYEAFCCSATGDATTMSSADTANAISVEELKQRLDAGEKPFVLDVRNPDEYAICSIEGSHLIPLGELPDRLGELDRDQEIIIHCKMGGRGGQALQLLREQGFDQCKNLTGGILAWAQRIDPSLTTY